MTDDTLQKKIREVLSGLSGRDAYDLLIAHWNEIEERLFERLLRKVAFREPQLLAGIFVRALPRIHEWWLWDFIEKTAGYATVPDLCRLLETAEARPHEDALIEAWLASQPDAQMIDTLRQTVKSKLSEVSRRKLEQALWRLRSPPLQ